MVMSLLVISYQINFGINLGVKQGDPPNPSFFFAPTINDIRFPCLFWVDDLVSISTTKNGLQNQLNVVNEYCFDWKLTLNAKKNKNSNFQ